MKRALARFCRRLASWMEPSPIDEALRQANHAIAIRREHLANISKPRSYVQEVEAIRLEQELEAELRDAGRKHLTPMGRKLRSVR